MISLFSFLHIGTAFMVVVYFRSRLVRQLGLVSLILLGWELRASYITILYVQGIPILSPLLFTPSLFPHYNLNLLVSSHF